jgi:hypothetical protein
MSLFRREPMTKKQAQRMLRRGGRMSGRQHEDMLRALEQPDSPFRQAKKEAQRQRGRGRA